MKELRYAHFYMDLASRVAKMSYSQRKQVGCVVVKDNNIISYGWNGMPAGMPNQCEVLDLDTNEMVTRPEVSHAEENALAKLAKSSNSSLGADVYLTLSPCMQCAKLLYSSGIANVYFAEAYRDQAGVEYLLERGVNAQLLFYMP